MADQPAPANPPEHQAAPPDFLAAGEVEGGDGDIAPELDLEPAWRDIALAEAARR